MYSLFLLLPNCKESINKNENFSLVIHKIIFYKRSNKIYILIRRIELSTVSLVIIVLWCRNLQRGKKKKTKKNKHLTRSEVRPWNHKHKIKPSAVLMIYKSAYFAIIKFIYE